MARVSLRLERAEAAAQPLGVVPNGHYYGHEKGPVDLQNETSLGFGAFATRDAGQSVLRVRVADVPPSPRINSLMASRRDSQSPCRATALRCATRAAISP